MAVEVFTRSPDVPGFCPAIGFVSCVTTPKEVSAVVVDGDCVSAATLELPSTPTSTRLAPAFHTTHNKNSEPRMLEQQLALTYVAVAFTIRKRLIRL